MDDIDGLVVQDVADLVQQFLVVLPRAADDGDDLLVVELGQLVRHLHLALVDNAHHHGALQAVLMHDGLERRLDLVAARRRELQRAVGLARVEERALLLLDGVEGRLRVVHAVKRLALVERGLHGDGRLGRDALLARLAHPGGRRQRGASRPRPRHDVLVVGRGAAAHFALEGVGARHGLGGCVDGGVPVHGLLGVGHVRLEYVEAHVGERVGDLVQHVGVVLHEQLDLDRTVLGEVVVVRLEHDLRVVVVEHLEQGVLHLLELLVVEVLLGAARDDHVLRDKGVHVLGRHVVDAVDVRLEHVHARAVKAREQLALHADVVARRDADDEAAAHVLVLLGLALGLVVRGGGDLAAAADGAGADDRRGAAVHP